MVEIPSFFLVELGMVGAFVFTTFLMVTVCCQVWLVRFSIYGWLTPIRWWLDHVRSLFVTVKSQMLRLKSPQTSSNHYVCGWISHDISIFHASNPMKSPWMMNSPWIHGESRPGRSHRMAVLRAGASQRCRSQSCDIKVQYGDNVGMAL